MKATLITLYTSCNCKFGSDYINVDIIAYQPHLVTFKLKDSDRVFTFSGQYRIEWDKKISWRADQ